MKVVEIKYSRKFNIGNYESEEYGVAAIVEDGDKSSEVFDQLKEEVLEAHKGSGAASLEKNDESDEEEENDNDNKSNRGGKSPKKDADADGDDSNEDNPGEDSDGADSEGEDDNKDSDADEDEKPPKTGKGKPKAGDGKGKKGFKKKPEVYARENKAHKDLFANVLTEIAPNWKKDMPKAKKVSLDMEGEDFLDADGEVVASFKQSLKKAMKK